MVFLWSPFKTKTERRWPPNRDISTWVQGWIGDPLADIICMGSMSTNHLGVPPWKSWPTLPMVTMRLAITPMRLQKAVLCNRQANWSLTGKVTIQLELSETTILTLKDAMCRRPCRKYHRGQPQSPLLNRQVLSQREFLSPS